MRNRAHTYFVGRRQFESAEVYTLTGSVVTRLRPQRVGRALSLDWQGGDAALLELSHVMLTRVAKQIPGPSLETRFAIDVVAELPHDGFVLEADEIRGWLQETSGPDDFVEIDPAPPRSWFARLRSGRRTA